jgi:hypothetical protein
VIEAFQGYGHNKQAKMRTQDKINYFQKSKSKNKKKIKINT